MTGKTSLATLMSRALVHRHEENKKKAVVFNFSALGMSREGKTFDQIFVEYCKVEWEYATVTLPASHCMVYLVLDETKLIYEEDSSPIHKSTCFWELVKRVQTDAGFQVRIVMFAAYGSDVVYSRLATPTKFNDEMVFGIKELTFSHAEVIEYVTKWFEGRSSLEGSPSMMEAFCANLEVLTGGHVGLCASAVSALNQVFQSRRKSASDFPSADEWISMLQTGAMYKPNDAELFKDLIETRAVKVLETLSVEKLDRLERTSFGANQDVAIVDECLRKGILAQRKHKTEFSSPVMWRYFVRLRVGHIERADHAPVTLPEMIVRVLSTVDYSSIRETLGRSFLSGIPLERTLQMEFYKAAYRCTPQNFVTSADVGALFGPPGFIDFTIQGNDGFWGVELTREANNLAEHIERFSPGGLYSSLGLTDFCLIHFRCVGLIDESVMERIAADMGLCGKFFVVCYDARMTGAKFNSVMKIVYQVDFR